jgi:hypothetical protein
MSDVTLQVREYPPLVQTSGNLSSLGFRSFWRSQSPLESSHRTRLGHLTVAFLIVILLLACSRAFILPSVLDPT